MADKLKSIRDFVSQENGETFISSYVPLDLAASVKEWDEGVQGGESCRIEALKDRFAWMRGFINGWYGWANDGKSEMRGFLKVLKAKVDGWKFAVFAPEDMDTILVGGKPQIKANRIYKNLAWTLTGKTWNKNFSNKYFIPQMTLEEEMEALNFIQDHIYVIYPRDRQYKRILDEFKFLYEKFGIDGFEIDPFSGVLVPDMERADVSLSNCFFEIKEFALQTNTVFDIISHPKSVHDHKEKDGRFKVVNQFMILGGSAWDMKMDGQFSIYRPERHLDPSNPKVHFHNLKQKQAQIVGVERGVTENIEFIFTKKQYWFDGVNPMTGEVRHKPAKPEETLFYNEPETELPPLKPGEAPF